MLVAFSFKAKPGREREFEHLLNNPDSGRGFAMAMGATRNTLFLNAGRMIRIVDIPEGVKPTPMEEIMEKDPNVKAFLRKLGSIIEDGFDPDVPGSLEAFDRGITFPLAYDVRL